MYMGWLFHFITSMHPSILALDIGAFDGVKARHTILCFLTLM